MSVKPGSKTIHVCAGAGPVPQTALSEFPVDFADVPPSAARVLAEVDEHEYEPKRLIAIAVALVHYRGLQRIEAVFLGIGTCGADLAGIENADISHTSD